LQRLAQPSPGHDPDDFLGSETLSQPLLARPRRSATSPLKACSRA